MRPGGFRDIALAGVAESDLGRVPGKTAIQLAAEASARALADAGLGKSDIDGLFTFGFGRMGAVQFGEYLSIRPRYSDSSFMGGSTPVAFLGHAAAAISAGLCQVALVCYGSTQASDAARKLGGAPEDPRLPASQYERPFGLPTPLGAYALAATRTPADIDVAEIYDSFTITVLLTLEDLGFCPKGAGGAFVAKQRTAPGSDFPLNTQGGGLSYCHPGVFGIFTVIEAVRQLRGECGARQVADAGVALCHGTGGVLSSSGTAILGRF